MKFDQFEYAGLNSWDDLEFVVGRVEKYIAPTMSEITQSVPGKYGNIYTGTNYESVSFNIPITIPAENYEEYNRKIENIRAAFINTEDEKGVEYPLIFGDRPEVTYRGHWTQLPTPTFVSQAWDTQVTLVFTCSEPYGYLEQRDVNIRSPQQTIVAEGNATSLPVYSFDLKKDVSVLGYIDQNSGHYTALGYTVDDENSDDAGNKINDKEPLVVNDPCASMSDWTTDAEVVRTVSLENGEVDGKMMATPNSSLRVADYTPKKDSKGKYNDEYSDAKGNPYYNWGKRNTHKAWYGPVAVRTGVPNPTSDWQVSFRLHHEHKYQRAMGKVEVYLLDESGLRRGKIQIKDLSHGRMPVSGVQLGDHGHHVEILQDTNKGGSYVGPTDNPSTGEKWIVHGGKKVVKLKYEVKVKVKVKDKKTGKTKTKTTKKKIVKSKTKKGGSKSAPKTKLPKKKVKVKYKETTKTETKTEYYYDNKDVFSSFYGEFYLRKVGQKYKCWIEVLNLKTGKKVATIGKREYEDVDHEFDFAFNTCAVWFAKYDITEDKLTPRTKYKTDFLTLTNFKYWNIIDGGYTDPLKPQIIAHSGERVIFDSETCHVYKDDGTSLDKYLSMASVFPPLQGGQSNIVSFDPVPTTEADITLSYFPRIK